MRTPGDFASRGPHPVNPVNPVILSKQSAASQPSPRKVISSVAAALPARFAPMVDADGP
jgi:hypothetical protein